MKIIHRYLLLALMRGYALVTASFVALFGLFEFMDRADGVGDRGFTVADAALVTVMALPSRMVDLSPFIAMLGVVYGLGTLTRFQELIAIRVAGQQPRNLSLICAAASLGFMSLVAVVETAARPMAQQAELLSMAANSADGAIFTKEGIWVQQGSTYLHIDSLSRGGAPRGVHVYEFDEANVLTEYLRAEEASINDDGSWQLKNVLRKRYPLPQTTGDPGTATPPSVVQRVTTRRFAQLRWQGAAQRNLAFYGLTLENLTLGELHSHMTYLESQNQLPGNHALEFWHRCLLPVAAGVFTLFAVPFVLGVGPRSSVAAAVAKGLAIALVLYLVQQLIGNSIYLALDSAVFAETLPLLLVAVPAAWMIRRVNGRPVH